MILEAAELWKLEKQRRAEAAREESPMTQDQIMGVVRWAIPFLGGMAVGKGWLTTAQVGELTDAVLGLVGPIMAAAGVIWSIKANSKPSIIASATNMTEVDSKKLAAAISDPALKEVAKNGDTTS
jgi:hypothetical protein